MSRGPVQLYAVVAGRPATLPVRPDATSIHDVYADLPPSAYTALRTYDHNKFLALDAHVRRLEESAARLGWPMAVEAAGLRPALHQACTAYPAAAARVRVDVLARPIPTPGGQSRLLIALAPFDPPPVALYERGVAVCLAPGLERDDPLVKNAAFITERRAYLESDPTCYEWLLLDEEERLLEGTTSNFYVVREGVLWTAGEGVLEGIARRIVLEVAAAEAVPVNLVAPRLADLSLMEEAAISSASRAIIPVVRVDGQTIGGGRPGPVIGRLLAAYREYVTAHLETAVPVPGEA